MNSKYRLITMILLSVLSMPIMAGGERITPLDGSDFTAEITSISETGEVSFNGNKAPVALQSLLTIARPVQMQPPAKGYFTVQLIDGSRIRASSAQAADGTLRISWTYGKNTALPFKAVAGIQLLASDAKSLKDLRPFSEFLDETVDDKEDAAYVLVGEKVEKVAGAIQALADDKLTIIWNGEAKKIARTKLYGVSFARTLKAPSRIGRCRVGLLEGSTIWGDRVTLNANKLSFVAVEALPFQLSWPTVQALEIKSDRVAYLSDLDPTEVEEKAQMTFAGPWQRDRSILGNPLSIGTKTFSKGLGVHALCRLSFENTNGFDQLASTIGLDSETNGKGDCVFKILGDGTEIFAQRMKGSDEPKAVLLKIASYKKVTLLVEPGEDFDLADHANWADARFIVRK